MVVTQPVPEPVPGDAAGVAPVLETPGARRSRVIGACLLLAMGVLHFALPKPFDKIVPKWVPGNPRLWTYVSGVWEAGSAALLLVPRTRRLGAWAALATFVAVYPANVQLALDNPPTDALGVGMWVRLPLQFPMIAWAFRHTRR